MEFKFFNHSKEEMAKETGISRDVLERARQRLLHDNCSLTSVGMLLQCWSNDCRTSMLEGIRNELKSRMDDLDAKAERCHKLENRNDFISRRNELCLFDWHLRNVEEALDTHRELISDKTKEMEQVRP